MAVIFDPTVTWNASAADITVSFFLAGTGTLRLPSAGGFRVAVRHDALNGVAASSAVVAGYAFQNSTTKRRLVADETKLIGRRLAMENTGGEEGVEVRA
jgi:hypothetical protein